MARLLDRFSPLFALGADLSETPAPGTADAHWALLQQRVLALLDEARLGAERDGVPAPRFESASYAVIAWIDERMARVPGDATGRRTLQAQRFNSNNAHTEFFHHLAAVPPGDDELREVYGQVLMHGFKGQYYFEQDDRGVLGKLKALHAPQQASPPPPADARSRAPPTEAHLPRVRRRPPRWRIALLIAIPASAWVLWLLWSGPRAPQPDLSRRLDLLLRSQACADLNGTLQATGRVQVSGFVASGEDMARLQQDVRALPGVREAGFDLALRVWPHCEVVALLKPYRLRNRATRTPLHIEVPSARDGRLREGDPVIVQVERPHDSDAIQVDYYLANGAVMHLGGGAIAVPPGRRIELGRDIPASWLVSPPFGHVLVTVVSSPSGLRETGDRPPFELASTYLLRLREALASNRNETLLADYVFLDAVER